MTENTQERLHWFHCCLEWNFQTQHNSRQAKGDMWFSNSSRNLNNQRLIGIKEGYKANVIQKGNINISEIDEDGSSLLITSISYLGHMTKIEFFEGGEIL